eukprot:CAMPEP_0114501080 /NCGR_PEP_ID=MMETSP0109-20121206/8306_1 /TAXON_ID=29199 /ORGANISM="Chlorarachnion reptans, Strain CCCM449" /LENGTH=59 /DNA_ID=CAMNT_0001678783 /DNA_START=940 /DNA_END=1116 /DNA_ORIENTATION=+
MRQDYTSDDSSGTGRQDQGVEEQDKGKYAEGLPCGPRMGHALKGIGAQGGGSNFRSLEK